MGEIYSQKIIMTIWQKIKEGFDRTKNLHFVRKEFTWEEYKKEWYRGTLFGGILLILIISYFIEFNYVLVVLAFTAILTTIRLIQHNRLEKRS